MTLEFNLANGNYPNATVRVARLILLFFGPMKSRTTKATRIASSILIRKLWFVLNILYFLSL